MQVGRATVASKSSTLTSYLSRRNGTVLAQVAIRDAWGTAWGGVANRFCHVSPSSTQLKKIMDINGN